MARKSTTDPFWVGDPFDHDNYVPTVIQVYGGGDAFGLGVGRGINGTVPVSCASPTANSLGTDNGHTSPLQDPFWNGDPYDWDNYVRNAPPNFGKGVAFGNEICSIENIGPLSA